MNLLDTHALIWFLVGDERLSSKARQLIETNEKAYVSICSLWEIAIKQSIGKLDIDDSIEDIARTCEEQHIQVLEITPQHLDCMRALSNIHKDPFDRLIVAQAQCEELTILTKDSKIQQYDVSTEW